MFQSVLTLKRVYVSRQTAVADYFSDTFFSLNYAGVVTIVSLGIILISIISYLAALFSTFGTGLDIQQYDLRIGRLIEEVSYAELKLNEAQILLLKGNQDFFESMEKVSSIRYIKPEGLAVFSLHTLP